MCCARRCNARIRCWIDSRYGCLAMLTVENVQPLKYAAFLGVRIGDSRVQAELRIQAASIRLDESHSVIVEVGRARRDAGSLIYGGE